MVDHLLVSLFGEVLENEVVIWLKLQEKIEHNKEIFLNFFIKDEVRELSLGNALLLMTDSVDILYEIKKLSN